MKLVKVWEKGLGFWFSWNIMEFRELVRGVCIFSTSYWDSGRKCYLMGVQ